MIWANKAIGCRQVCIPHADVTAVITSNQSRSTMVVSVYIPCVVNNQRKDFRRLFSRLKLIEDAHRLEKTLDPALELVVCGDFNRWDSLWGENHVSSHQRQGEAEASIDFMAELGLQNLLPRGTVTYATKTASSTIDLIFTTSQLADELNFCKIYEYNHGSDHEALRTKFQMPAFSAVPAP